MEAVQEAFVRVIKWRVENKLPDNISEKQNNFFQECGCLWEKNNKLHLVLLHIRQACDSVSPLK
jgi:hypothetical protein